MTSSFAELDTTNGINPNQNSLTSTDIRQVPIIHLPNKAHRESNLFLSVFLSIFFTSIELLHQQGNYMVSIKPQKNIREQQKQI